MLESRITVHTEAFDGPLALLLLLIQKQEMKIEDLDISVITKQYIDFLYQMQELNFDIAGDYLLMAATLLLIKSRHCISVEDEESLFQDLGINPSEIEITSKEELVKRLLTLHKFQKMGMRLWGLPILNREIFCHPRIDKKAIKDSVLTNLDLTELTRNFLDVLKRQQRRHIVINTDKISIQQKLEILKSFFRKGERLDFHSLLNQDAQGELLPIQNKVLTFISLLELARLKKVRLFQAEAKGNIFIDVEEDLDDFNTGLANGFENIQPTPTAS